MGEWAHMTAGRLRSEKGGDVLTVNAVAPQFLTLSAVMFVLSN